MFSPLVILILILTRIDHHACSEHEQQQQQHKLPPHTTTTSSKHVKPDEPELPFEHDHQGSHGEHDSDYDREMVAGTEAEQFKDLDPEESRERLGQLFDRMDQNGDGQLSRGELKHWIIHSLTNLDMEVAHRRLSAYDVDRDGFLTWPEYITSVYGYSLEEIENMRKDTSNDTVEFIKAVDMEKIKFGMADLDHNEKLNVTEYAAFEHPHNYRFMAPYEIKHTLSDYDRDHDGAINFEEFLIDEQMKPEDAAAEREHFKRYDTNNDGKLDREEMVHWVAPGFDKTAHDEVEHLFSVTDKDKNNLLTKEEVKEHHDYWVGSQATDYGRHLEDEL